MVAALGGSRMQVTGPTAAFIVILAPIYSRFGMAGLLISGVMGGLILIAMGLGRLGQFIEFIPHPVTTGFTAGIATVIATLQIKDVLGLQLTRSPESFFDRMAAMWQARGSASLAELGIAAATLALLLAIPRLTKRVPAPLIAIPLAGRARGGAQSPVPRPRRRHDREPVSRHRRRRTSSTACRRCRRCRCFPGTCPGRTARRSCSRSA